MSDVPDKTLSTSTSQTTPPIEVLLAAHGLHLSPDAAAKLEAAVTDLQIAAATVRIARSYLQEPPIALRLPTP